MNKKNGHENIDFEKQEAQDEEDLEALEQELAEPFKLEYLEDTEEFAYQTTIDWRGKPYTVNYKIVNIGERLAIEGNIVAFETLREINRTTLAREAEKTPEELMQMQRDETDLILQHLKVCVKELQDAHLEQIKQIHPLDLRKLYDLTSGAIKESSFTNRFPQRN